MFTRIHWRIAAGYVGLLSVVLVALGIYLVGFLQAQQLGELETQLGRQTLLVADGAEHRLVTQGPAGLDPLAKQLGQEIGARITLIAADGSVLADSDQDPASIDNLGARPEVLQALEAGGGQSQRHSAILENDVMYVAVPIERDGMTFGVARVALSAGEVRQASNRVATAVGSALAVAALLSTALAIILARMTVGPIQALTRVARRLARGDLDQTISMHGRDEVNLLARAFDEMAVNLRTHIRAVEGERERLAAVLSHMADGLVIADQHGVVRLINPVAARLLQTAPERAEGRSVMAVVRDYELAAMVDQAVSSADRAVGRPRLIELGARGQRRAVQAMASRIPGGESTGQQVLLILQDVTDLRQAETVRREFVANVSHELRTPVAALKALVETLQDGALGEPDVARDFLARMHVEVDGLAQLVEELLELSRIESGRVALRLQPMDLASVVATAVERLRPQAERQGLNVAVDLPSDLPTVQADSERIQQVIVNLVHNAVKFTPPGGRIAVSAERGNGEVAVSVADTGAGISPDALARLFERFYKADRARASGGTGLGLAIAKHLVQAHGGRIWAESPGEGQGATFSFALPQSTSASG
jgi:two-component system, OmpR family, phosphate regulon sensor histidine kinase PhoR